MMKKILAIIFCVLVTIAGAADWDGWSTSAPDSTVIDGKNYYVITSAEELAWFAYQVNVNNRYTINAVLANDIHFTEDASGTSTYPWNPIGHDSDHKYNGTIDGAGYTIHGLYSKRSLVGYTGTSFVLRRLSLKRSDVAEWVLQNNGLIEHCDETNEGMHQQAGFAYTNNGTIKNCTSRNYGIANTNNGVIDSCTGRGLVVFGGTGGIDVGGLVANNPGTIRNSTVELDRRAVLPQVSGNVYIGGIAALSDGYITNCRFRGSVSFRGSDTVATWAYIGGIAGRGDVGVSGSIAILDTLTVTSVAMADVGGIMGKLQQGYINTSYAELNLDTLVVADFGTTNNVSYVGGIVGETFYSSSVQNVHGLLKLGKGVSSTGVNGIKAASIMGYMYGSVSRTFRLLNSYGVFSSETTSPGVSVSGVVSDVRTYTRLENSYYDHSMSLPDTTQALGFVASSAALVANVSGMSTADMQSATFVERLNTNAGLGASSDLWQHCEGHYPILVSEGTCSDFYAIFGTIGESHAFPSSSSSSTEDSSSSSEVPGSSSSSGDVSSSSSSVPGSSSSSTEGSSSSSEVSGSSSSSGDVTSSSSGDVSSSSSSVPGSSSSSTEGSSSSSEVPGSSSSSGDVTSSSSGDVTSSSSGNVSSSSSSVPGSSSSSTEGSSSSSEVPGSSSSSGDVTSSSSSVPGSSSSSTEGSSSSSEEKPTTVQQLQPEFGMKLEVNGLRVGISSTQNGIVSIYDLLGHVVARLYVTANTETYYVMPYPGKYIIKQNGVIRSFNVR